MTFSRSTAISVAWDGVPMRHKPHTGPPLGYRPFGPIRPAFFVPPFGGVLTSGVPGDASGAGGYAETGV